MFTSPSENQKKEVIRLTSESKGESYLKHTFSNLSSGLRSFELIPYLKSKLFRSNDGQNIISKIDRLHQINMLLTLVLMVLVVLAWRFAPDVLASVDQLQNDLNEQAQVIKMEEQNNEFLVRLAGDRNGLLEKINIIYSAVPERDEQAENVISILEEIGLKNQVIIDSISIRPLAENQFYYDDLLGVVQPYQYTFSMETGLPNVMGFIGSLRSSRRILDVMTLDIEETDEGIFRSNMTVNAYHLTSL